MNCYFCHSTLQEINSTGLWQCSNHDDEVLHWMEAVYWDCYYKNRFYRICYYTIDYNEFVKFSIRRHDGYGLVWETCSHPNVTPENFQQKMPLILTFL
jgi:hypothetical protein